MAESIYANNWASLPDHLKELVPPPEDGAAFAHPGVRIVSGPNGHSVAVIGDGAEQRHTNSPVDPWSEAARWADSLAYKDMRVAFLYGCGFGYPLLEYAKRKKTYTETVVFEQSIPLFTAMLAGIDVRTLLNDPTVRFVVGDRAQMTAQLSLFLSGEFLLRCTMLSFAFTWMAHRHDKQIYLELHEWIWGLLDLCAMSIGNTVHDSLTGLYNTLDNAERIANGAPLSALRNLYAGKPAFIIANGPSLDKNADCLRDAVGKSLILAAESALRPCLERNIVPDAICVTERNPIVYHVHFAGQALPEHLVMAGLTVVDPRIPAEFAGPWLPIFRKHEHSAHWVRDAIADDDAALLGGTSSAHLAFELALWAGADPIVFVGQDLAFGPDKMTHSRLSAYSGERLAGHVRTLQEQEAFAVPGVDGKPVLTTKSWNDFRLWFEHQIGLFPDRTFVDATEGGAAIRGTAIMKLRDVINAYCRAPVGRHLYDHVRTVERAREGRSQPGEKLAAVLVRCEELRDRLRQWEASAAEDLLDCRLVDTMCRLHARQPDAPLPAFAESLLDRTSRAYWKYTRDADLSVYIQHIVFAFHQQINELGEIDTLARISELNGLNGRLLHTLRRLFATIGEQFEAAANRLRPRAAVPQSEDDG
ncbi:motility associated factor glycosyltransferase family protein [Paenibacillus hodogayensis]|uniref:Motility associated factor glycosyltransferase family protein n=1 Tax=Paenibacillus hodogayensis TaxID=279208 RepID=A0ABV5VYN6_9BACL